jgi:hypothetical protein
VDAIDTTSQIPPEPLRLVLIRPLARRSTRANR